MDEQNGSLGNQIPPAGSGGAAPVNPTPASPTPGIIASTPDVVAPPTDEQIAAAKANLAPRRPFFSPRRPGAAPTSGSAAPGVLTTTPAAPDTGDILLKPPKTPRNKKPLIIGLIVLAVIALVGGIVVFIATRSTTPEAVKTAFDAYYNLLVDGPEGAETTGEDNDITEGEEDEEDGPVWDDYSYSDEETDFDGVDTNDEEVDDVTSDSLASTDVALSEEDQALIAQIENESTEEGVLSDDAGWFIFRVNASSLSSDEREDYIEALESKYAELVKSAKRLKNSSEKKVALENNMDSYGSLLKMMSAFSLLDSYENDIEAYYLADGSDEAKQYINKSLPNVGDDELVQSLADAFRLELDGWLGELELYNKLGCIQDGIVDIFCDKDGNREYDKFMSQRSDEILAIEELLESFQDWFVAQTYLLENLLGVSQNE